MRQLLHIFILLLISFGLFAHSETTGAEFIANKGQWESPVLYKTAISSGAAYVELDGITFSFYHAEDAAALHDLQRATDEEKEAFQIRGHAWKMDFLNNLVPSFSEEGKRSHYYNYFHGQDKSQWTGKVPTYDHVRYQQLYAGVDMKLYHHDKNFKYDFIVAPGADPTPISWRYEGLDKLGLSKGVLQLHTSIGQFVESRPYAYQVIDGKETEVRCLYELNDGVVSFSYPDGYDTDYPLIIDPELVASTLSGSIGDIINFGHCATYDRLGNIYTGCVSGGPGYPVTLGSYSQSYAGGQWDIGISKLNPDGSDLLWATYIGGEAADYPHSIIVNQDLEIYVYGSSRSEGFPTTSSAFQPSLGGNSDIIVSHLSEDGSELVGSTYIGGFGNDGFNAQAFNYGDAYRGEINLDNEENPIIVSHSTSTNFPTLPNSYQSDLNGQQDAVIIGLDPSLSTLQRSTYLGGTYNDAGYGIRMNSEGDIYIAGGANADFPTTANAYQPDFNGSPFAFESSDGFIAKLNGDCTQLLASTYLGTDGSDQAFFIDLNNEEEVFVYGQNGADFPVVGDVFTINNGRQFVSKLSADLSQLLLSTTLGTTFVTVFVPDAFLVDICGNVYISAYYADQQLPTTSDALSDEGGFYLAVFEPDMADIYYGTYYTGNHVDGGTSRFDKNGVVYQAVCSCPPVNDMNTLSNAWATTQEDNCDVGIFKIAFDFGGVNAAIANTDPQGCAPFEVTFENLSIGDVYDWDFGDGETSTAFEPTHTFETPGTYTVSLIATDELSCNYADTTYLDIIVSPPENPEPTYDVDVDCDEQSVTLNVTSGDLFMDYHWDMGDGSTFSSQDSTYEYGSDGDYEIVLTATALGCNPGTEFVSEIDIDISIDPVVTAALQNEVNEACGELALALENLSENASEYEWDFGDGFTSSAATPAHTYTTPGSYDITLTAINPNGCNTSDQASISVTVHPLQSLASDFTIEQTDCAELIVVADNQSVGNDVDYSWDMGDGTILTTEDVTHSYATDGTYTVVLTVTDPLCDISVESTEEITAYPLATAVMNVVDQIGCEPFSVNLATSSPGTAVWDFGDGTAPEEGSALAHNYPLPGVYTVTLTVEGPGACSGVAESTGTIDVKITSSNLMTIALEISMSTTGVSAMVNQARNNTLHIVLLPQAPTLSVWLFHISFAKWKMTFSRLSPWSRHCYTNCLLLRFALRRMGQLWMQR